MKTNLFRAMMLTFLFSLTVPGLLKAQELTVTGTVTDSYYGKPIVDCQIVVKGTSRSTLSDKAGKFSIRAKQGNTLVFSHAGFDKQGVIVKGKTMNVKLISNVVTCEDVSTETSDIKMDLSLSRDMYSSKMLVQCPMPQEQDEYKSISENGFKKVSESPLSTFSVDVDVASYSNMRRMLNNGQLPQTDAIRTEELVNYFSYDYPKPTGKDPVKVTMEAGICPWNPTNRLVRIALKQERYQRLIFPNPTSFF